VRDAADYLNHIRARIIANPGVAHWNVVREEAQGALGLFRYRLALRDGGLLEAFEFFEVADGHAQVRRYSFHWQDSAGHLRKRWDNAAHHPETPTHPYHVHEGGEQDVVAHGPVTFEQVLATVTADTAV
jgi:hypothetical protein